MNQWFNMAPLKKTRFILQFIIRYIWKVFVKSRLWTTRYWLPAAYIYAHCGRILNRSSEIVRFSGYDIFWIWFASNIQNLSPILSHQHCCNRLMIKKSYELTGHIGDGDGYRRYHMGNEMCVTLRCWWRFWPVWSATSTIFYISVFLSSTSKDCHQL